MLEDEDIEQHTESAAFINGVRLGQFASGPRGGDGGIADLKRQSGKEILVAGSGSVVRALSHHNLVNEYRLLVYPVVLDRGSGCSTDARCRIFG